MQRPGDPVGLDKPFQIGNLRQLVRTGKLAAITFRSCEPDRMNFGDKVTAADSVAPADWIGPACGGSSWTVGALVPNQYPLILRVNAPDPQPEGWWSEYRHLFEVIASIGERHTASRDRAWFAVWEGHGFENTASVLRVPRFNLPDRTYYLLEASVSAVARLRYPDSSGEWRNPDLYWPDDRRWFVATDVDFWSLYIGGDGDFFAELVSSLPTGSNIVTLNERLPIEN